ncbi:MAG TPA: hypothetical protein VFK52_04065 [Nocardioidaceae bacterium]|nr:hypothetical protein [Nocardioidaceae bacterium]
MKKILVCLAVPTLAVGLGVTAEAAPSRGSSGATLNVSMTGALATASTRTAVFDGCGYVPGGEVRVKVESATATSIMGVAANANGCISTSDRPYPVDVAGTWKASTWQSSTKRADASVTWTVN